MAWIRRSTYHWIAIVYLAMLSAQATGFSACQHKPQEIRITRGQKITVVYWVGQNALDDGAFEGKLASEIPSTSVPEEASTSAEDAIESSSEAVTSQSIADESVSFRHGEISTVPNLQSVATERVTTSVTELPSTEAPSTALPGTSPRPALNSNALSEDAITPETQEASLEEIGISGRNNTAELESTTSGATPEATFASEVDVTSAQSEIVDLNTASTQADVGSTTLLGRRSESEGITSEVEYWSTTPVSDEQEEDSTGTDSFVLEEKNEDVTTEGPRRSKLDDATEIVPNATSEESLTTEGSDEATSITDKTLLTEDPRNPKLDEASESPTEAPADVTTGESESTSPFAENKTTTNSNDPRNGKLDENTSASSVEATEENVEAFTTESVANETIAKSLDSNIANETNVEGSTEVFNNDSEVTIAGRQADDGPVTVAQGSLDTTSSSDTELVTESGAGAEVENSTEGIEGRLVESLDNNTESINASNSSQVNLEVRAAFDAETLRPIQNDTEESAEIISEGSSQPSVLEVISSTFKNLFSTLAPSTEESIDENLSPTEETLDGREQGVNVTAELQNLESRKHDLSNETLEGIGQQSNATSEIAGIEDSLRDSSKETLEGIEKDSNSTLEIIYLEGREQNTSNETVEGRERYNSSSDNDTITSSPDIVFRNTTAENGVTIDPRSADNSTFEELSSTTELPEESSENLTQRSDITNETVTNPPEPPKATGEIENITEEVFNSQRVVTETSPGAEYDESELQDGELDESDNHPTDGFDAPPSDIFIPIGQPGVDEDPESGGSTDEARKMASYPMDNFESFMHHNAPDLLRIPVDDSQYEKENRRRDFLRPSLSKDRTKPIHFLRPSIYNARNPFPPPYLTQFPARRSDNAPHPFSGYLIPEGADPPIFTDDLQPQPSLSGSFYPSDDSMDSIVLPPESPVHYVSVMRPPDGVLPIRSLRMSPAQRGSFHQQRAKREIHANATNCQWNFKSDPGVPLLLTFKSFSTPETPDCEEHFIAVERESNGFQSRWCGVSGERPGHASFARSEINLHLYSNGDGSFPTGFSVEVQALDLKLLRKYAEVRRIIKHQ